MEIFWRIFVPNRSRPFYRAPVISTATRLRYTQGYLALEMFEAAQRELDAIDEADRHTAPVLGLQLELEMGAERWSRVGTTARRLTVTEPKIERAWIALAYALRELNRVEEARATLLAAEPLHGATSALLQYNLGCYECLLGNLDEARRRLREAYRLDPALREGAKGDPDLVSLDREP